MDIDKSKIGDWPNVALVPGTHIHAATGEHVEQPENTRIGRSRGACRPDDADCEHEPADVENRPQDGAKLSDLFGIWKPERKTKKQLRAEAVERLKESRYHTHADYVRAMLGWGHEPHFEDSRDALIDLLTDDDCGTAEAETSQVPGHDTREKLEADIRRTYWCLSEQEIEPVFGWLDRQAAIVEREVLCQPDERDEQIAELTSERDNWANCYDMAVKRGQNLLSKIDELTAERDKLKAKLETYGKVPDQGEREESQPVESGDTRENLEVDMFYAVTRLWNEAYKLGSRNGVGGFKIDEPFYKLLDRQAAITEHNCRMEYEDMRDYLQARVDSLTAEHDELERANSRQARKIHDVCELNEKLTAENKRLRVEWESERDFADQCETRAKELAAERDHLREVVKAQADSFAKLERELHEAMKKEAVDEVGR